MPSRQISPWLPHPPSPHGSRRLWWSLYIALHNGALAYTSGTRIYIHACDKVIHSILKNILKCSQNVRYALIPYKLAWFCVFPCTMWMYTSKTDTESVITALWLFKLNIIFSGDVVGRQCLSVKICSCPKRDKEREEGDVPLSGAWSAIDTCTKSKKKSYDSKYVSKRARQENNHQMVIDIFVIYLHFIYWNMQSNFTLVKVLNIKILQAGWLRKQICLSNQILICSI